jgi:hypothetical protein
MLLAAVTRLDKGLSFETLLTLKVKRIPRLLRGYTETNGIHNRTVEFVLENVNEKYTIEILLSGIKCSEN